MNVRHLEEADYDPIMAVLDDWFWWSTLGQAAAKDFLYPFSANEFCHRGGRQSHCLSGRLRLPDLCGRGIHPLCCGSSRLSWTWSWTPPLLDLFRHCWSSWMHRGSLYYFPCEH